MQEFKIERELVEGVGVHERGWWRVGIYLGLCDYMWHEKKKGR